MVPDAVLIELQAGDGVEAFVDADGYQLLRRGPLKHHHEPPDVAVDVVPALPFAREVGAEGFEFLGAEVEGVGVAIELLERAEGLADVVELPGGAEVFGGVLFPRFTVSDADAVA